MKNIPATKDALVLRTDFTDERAWQALCSAIQEPMGDFRAYVTFVSDPEFADITSGQFLAAPTDQPDRSFVFLADTTAHVHPEHPILVLDLWRDPGRTFRVIPSEVQGVENNLSIANMDFAEFADDTDPDGIFRGFPMTAEQRDALHHPIARPVRKTSLLARILITIYKLLRGKPMR